MSSSGFRLSVREFRRTLRVVEDALRSSDDVILGAFGRVRVERKADGSEVTAADRGAERALRTALHRAFPGDAFSGEEHGGARPRSGWGWVVDPIDGTASFVLGLPTFGTLVARTFDGEPVFGVVHLPALKETTFAAAGQGCWFRRDGGRARRVRASSVTALAQAAVGVTTLSGTELARSPGRWRFAPVLSAAGRVRPIADCLQYALLCRGLLDAALDPVMKPWDIAALVPCVREAGGAIAPLGGAYESIIEAGSLAAAATPALLREIQRLAQPRRRSSR